MTARPGVDETPPIRVAGLTVLTTAAVVGLAFVARLGATVGLLPYAATIPFLTFFMLKDREKFGRVLAGILTRNERLGESDVTGAISRTMTAYALGLSFPPAAARQIPVLGAPWSDCIT